MVEQQGSRIHHSKLPEFTGKRFLPSKISIMLFYRGDEDGIGCQLVQSQYEASFKNSMVIKHELLLAGRYIVAIAPEFNKQAELNPKYLNVRTGIYSPITVKLEKCKPEAAYEIMEKVFTQIALSKEINDPMTKLPEEYEDRVFKELNYDPVDGKFGYLIFKNDSEYNLEQELQLDL